MARVPKAPKVSKAAPEAPQTEIGRIEDAVFDVDLPDTTPVMINGALQQLPKGRQQVGRQIYNVLRDANLTK